MAGATQWTWPQPIGGKVIGWKPITVGDEMDIEAGYRHENNRHLARYMRLAVRIVSVDGVAKRVEMQDLRSWDSYDLDAFFEEVQVQEARRAAALTKSDGSSPIVGFRAAAERVGIAMAELAVATREAIAAAEAVSARPTEPPQPR